MGKSFRDIAQIAVGIGAGFLGPGAFSAGQFALGTLLFNWIWPPKQPNQSGGGAAPDFGTTYNTSNVNGKAIREIYGLYEVNGGDLLRCNKDGNGRRSGIVQQTITSTTGGGGSGHRPSAPAQTVTTTNSYLYASFGLAAGYTFCDRITRMDNKNGETVIWDRFGANHGIAVTPVMGSVSGLVIGELSDTVRLWYGTEEQPQDAIEAGWYVDEGGTQADRGIAKVVFNGYGPLETGTTFKFLMRSAHDWTRREIITSLLTRAGIPASRIDLQSIDMDAADFGWLRENVEPARVMAEMVAGVSLHDLACLATSRGFALRDISRANPTYIQIADRKAGAYENIGGSNEAPATSSKNQDSTERAPRAVTTSYIDHNTNYSNESAYSIWPSENGPDVNVTMPWVADLQKAQDLTDITHAEVIAAKGSEAVNLMPEYAEVAPGNVIVLNDPSPAAPDGVRYLRVMQQPLHTSGILECHCVPYDPVAYGRHRTVEQPTADPPVVVVWDIPTLLILDSVSLTDYMASTPGVLMGSLVPRAGNFAGTVVTTDSDAFDTTLLSLRTSAGLSVGAYSYNDADLNNFRYDVTIRVSMTDGVLVSSDEDTVRAGANVLYWGGTYLQFVTATPVTGQPFVYDLTGILPGLFGSDSLYSSIDSLFGRVRTYNNGSRVVKITDHLGRMDPAVQFVPVVGSKLHAPGVTYEAHAAPDPARSTGDLALVLQGNNVRPLAPGPSIIKSPDGAGGYYVNAFARTRYADSEMAYWDASATVRYSDPLTFHCTIYDVLDNVISSQLITSVDGQINFHYTNAQLVSWFGTVPATLKLSIQQDGEFFDGFVRYKGDV